MEYRRLGRTGLEVSAVGFGTNQLRLVPEARAIDTLVRGFELGVNIVHTSADYEGAEDLVARAIERSGRRVIVAANGYDVHYNTTGRARHFEQLFEATCARLRTDRLDLYGIAAVEDRDAYQENVWGKGGMVEFLLRMKEQGRLGGIFCTTHGEPAYVRKLIESGVFDAIMVSYNPLGYHLLSLNPPPGRHFENLPRNRLEIFPLCREHDVGLMIMMPLAGGLLTDSRAFPARDALPDTSPGVGAGDILRSILLDPEISCVMPGTASVAEAEENASAGRGPIAIPAAVQAALQARVSAKQATICSRCGVCDSLCSRQQPVSWLFRAAYIGMHPSETFETWRDVEYFKLHPSHEPKCASCDEITCSCPYGIDIPGSLIALHGNMLALAERGLVPSPPEDPAAFRGTESFGARILLEDIPIRMRAGETCTCRLYLENTGTRGWFRRENQHRGGAVVAVSVNGARVADVWPRDDVHAGGRGHFVFELSAPQDAGSVRLSVQMLGEHEAYSEQRGMPLVARDIRIADRAAKGIEGPTAIRPRASPHVVQPPEARRADYDVRWCDHNLPEAWREGEPCHVYLRVDNLGARTWHADHAAGQNVDLVVRVNGAILAMVRVPHAVAPGQSATLKFAITLPTGLGDWELAFSFVEQNVAWFEQHGARPLHARIRRMPADRGPTAGALEIARRSNPSLYSPSQGIAFGRDGRAYPQVIREAAGARIRDPDGNEWIDYVMGYGAALLGYAHPDVSLAISKTLDCGSILSLPHELEMEVTEVLCELIPCAETVLFGKNGSDACTAAVRVARVHTGRATLLFSGYHGWQDPFANVLEPALAHVGCDPQAHRFRLNDLDGFCRLVKEHSGKIAAVMLEPAAQVEGVDGPVRDCDPGFLRQVAEICREQGAVLIFDEIMTGFRYARGTVQQATGVTPDLACLGKALASGMPLSALVGRRDVIEPSLSRIFYHPTYKGDAYSFAAAAAALRFYRSHDVPRQLRQFGDRLREGVDRITREVGLRGRIVGPAYRMVYKFDEPDETRRVYLRTLLHQELLLGGVLTFRGFLIPSVAHGEAELDRTLSVYRSALERVRTVAATDSFASHLEIPLLA